MKSRYVSIEDKNGRTVTDKTLSMIGSMFSDFACGVERVVFTDQEAWTDAINACSALYMEVRAVKEGHGRYSIIYK